MELLAAAQAEVEAGDIDAATAAVTGSLAAPTPATAGSSPARCA